VKSTRTKLWNTWTKTFVAPVLSADPTVH